MYIFSLKNAIFATVNYLRNTSHDPHWNLAFEEGVLENEALDEPLFWLWQNGPSVIIGENQSAYAEVNLPYLKENGIVLARRVTGGGAVYHDLGNLNYTFCSPFSEGADLGPSMIADALRSLGVPASLSGRNDILVDGRKCSGYAKRLWHNRVMYHGTLMWDVNLDKLTAALSTPSSKLITKGVASVRSRVANLKDYLPQFTSIEEFTGALASQLNPGEEIKLPAPVLDGIQRLAKEKFASWDWLYGHSPKTTVTYRKHFSCGNIEASFNLIGGRISALSFTGDFIGDLPASELTAALDGTPYTEEALSALLSTLPVSRYFDSLTPLELTHLLSG